MKILNTCLSILSLLLSLCEVQGQGVEWLQTIRSSNHGNYLSIIDNGWRTAIDNHGFIYSAGNFSGNARFGTHVLDGKPFDMFVTKYNTRGKFAWAKKIEVGNPYSNTINDIKADNEGSLYVYGSFVNYIVFDHLSVVNEGGLDSKNLFLAKYDSSGNVVWAKSFGGPDTDTPGGLVIDPSGNVIISGTVSADSYFDNHTITGGFQTDVFLAKISTNGEVLKTHRWQRDGYQNAEDLAIDLSGNLIICGAAVENEDINNPIPYSPENEFTFMLKYSDTFNELQFIKEEDYMGTFMNGIHTDQLGNTYRISSNNIVKYDVMGVKLWKKSLIDPQSGMYYGIQSITSNTYGDVYLTGTSYSNYQVYVKKLDTNGTQLWETISKVEPGYVFGNGYTLGNDIVADQEGNLFITGNAISGITTLDGIVINQPSYDILLFKINDHSFLQPSANNMSVSQGINYAYFEQGWTATIPDFSSKIPLKRGSLTNISFSPINRNTNFSFQYTGLVEVPLDGEYTFHTVSDDGSKLYIHNQLVVKNDGIHSIQNRSGKIQLKAGKHPFSLEYLQNRGDKVLSLFYQGPRLNKKPVPDEALYRVNFFSALRDETITNEVNPENVYSLYPVPASNEIIVSFKTNDSPSLVVIADALFNIIPVVSNNSANEIKFNLSNLPSGNYYMLIVNDGNREIKKFTVIK